jgi:hypothetical protein
MEQSKGRERERRVRRGRPEGEEEERRGGGELIGTHQLACTELKAGVHVHPSIK